MKAERDVRMFVPVCSSAAGMPCIISKDEARRKRGAFASRRILTPNLHKSALGNSKIPVSADALACSRTYYGVADGVGEAASVTGDGVAELASGAGNTVPLNIFDLPCFWFCNCSACL
jgi:hypothetical protein